MVYEPLEGFDSGFDAAGLLSVLEEELELEAPESFLAASLYLSLR
jgi:preprotein translocase subunit Sec61beta